MRRPLVVPDSLLRSRAARRRTADINRDAIDALHTAADVVVVPHLGEDRITIVRGAAAGLGLVEARARAADVGQLAEFPFKRVLDVGDGVARGVGGADAALGEPAPRRQRLVVGHDRSEEVGDFGVRGVGGAVALGVEAAEAGRVLAEFVGPEGPAGLVLADPVSGGLGG